MAVADQLRRSDVLDEGPRRHQDAAVQPPQGLHPRKYPAEQDCHPRPVRQQTREGDFVETASALFMLN